MIPILAWMLDSNNYKVSCFNRLSFLYFNSFSFCSIFSFIFSAYILNYFIRSASDKPSFLAIFYKRRRRISS